MIASAAHCIRGFGTGYYYAKAKTNEEAALEEKNHLSSSFYQSIQTLYVSSLLEKIIDRTAPLFLVSPVATTLSMVSLAACCALLSAGVVIGGYYPHIYQSAQVVKTSHDRPLLTFLVNRLPENLSTRTIKIMTVANDYTGQVARIIMISGSLLLIALKQYAYGTTVLCALTYEVLDHHFKVIPSKVSSLMKTLMPLLYTLGLLLSESWISRTYAILCLPFYSSYCANLIYLQIDNLVRSFSFFGLQKAPSLAVMQAHLIQQKNLSYDQICTILKTRHFEWNYAHFSFDWSHPSQTGKLNPFEIKIYQTLANTRTEIVKSLYQGLLSHLPEEQCQRFESYLQRLVDSFLKLGFCPMTSAERSAMGFEQLAAYWVWQRLGTFDKLYAGYKAQYEEAIPASDASEIENYVKGMIRQNSTLDEMQKKEISNKLFPEKTLGRSGNAEKARYLMYVMLGILSSPVPPQLEILT